VRLSGEKGWRETKNACLINATHQTFDRDPQPEPPACFCNPRHVAKIVQTETLSVAAPPATSPAAEDSPCESDEPAQPGEDWRPKRRLRTVISSMQPAKQFGRQMRREAQRRRFFEAPAKAFLGDGLAWNWKIRKQCFPGFTEILDFIHPLSYLFLAAKAVHPLAPDDAWSQYLVWMRGCWQGEVAQVLAELRVWQDKLGPPLQTPDSDPRAVVASTIGYLENNQHRMNYPEYRRAGLPVTTAWMESYVKEMNYRVKGTEMFWNDPDGGEHILQVRAGALCDDDRLSRHLQFRPGYPFVRRPKRPKLSVASCKC
jgi:hypothetical protein